MLTTSCTGGLAAAVWAAEIPADQLTGRWTSGSGTSLTFREDHTFIGVRPAGMPSASHCADPSVLASGRWAFEVFPEEGGFGTPDEAATRGSVVSLRSADGDCEVTAYLFGDEDDPVLCPTDDTDVGCPEEDYLKREQAAPESP
ncbi:hypothetical protein OG539_07425 [Actinacidiphila glaucinigra]|uniref:hypothetical protein n=1 Tax=Actinacidiphila glaucinigra TaxID=235986 RepID=UPI002DDC3F7A|nr:hypothetical protein [Actinacidiphila glaucinigra]WSD63807.1 hypothetical protein OIE69_35420 [Actinacidiphila glaucinigra]